MGYRTAGTDTALSTETRSRGFPRHTTFVTCAMITVFTDKLKQ